MNINTGIKANVTLPSTSASSGSPLDALPGLFGTAGSTIGGLSGATIGAGGAEVAGLGPEDPLADAAAIPAGAEGYKYGSTIGGGTGQAVGDILKNLLEGRGFNPGETLSNAVQGGMYGAIPGGKAGAGIVKNTATRALGGGLIGAGTQAVRNAQARKPLTQNLVSQGVGTGVINAALPAVGKVASIVPKTSAALGRVATKSARNIIENSQQPELQSIQHLFGKQAMNTSGGKAYVDPTVSSLIEKYNIPIAPKGNIAEFEPALTRAQKDVESQLQPILKDPKYSVPYGNVKKIVSVNGTSLPRGTKVPSDIITALGKVGTKATLSQIKSLQRTVGQWVNWGNPTQPLDKFGTKTYRELGDLIDSKLSSNDKPEYKDLIKQHQVLSKARDASQKVLSGSGILPSALTSTERAQSQAQTGLSGERLRELGAKSLPAATTSLAIAANAIPGVPDWLKNVADVGAVGSDVYGAAQFGPHLNPEAALNIGQNMQNVPRGSQALQQILQQLGVRLPSIGN